MPNDQDAKTPHVRLNNASPERSGCVDSDLPPNITAESVGEDISVGESLPFEPDEQRVETVDPEYIWVRFPADRAPHDGLDYTSEVEPRSALTHERLAREEAERRLDGVLDLVAERHSRKRRPTPPPVPAAEVGKPEIDDTIKAKVRKALRRGGFVVKT